MAIVRELFFFFFFWEESCKSLRAAPGLRVTISCLEERIISPLEHEAAPTPSLTPGLRAPGRLHACSAPRRKLAPSAPFVLRRDTHFLLAPGGPRGEVTSTACQPGVNYPSPGGKLTVFPSCPGAGSWMTPTLRPGFSPSRLQPDNFLASKAIWYPAARQEVWVQLGGRQGPEPLETGRTSSVPFLLVAFHSSAGSSRQALSQRPAAWAQPPACRVDKTQGASFAACGPGQFQNGQQSKRHM